VVSNVFGSGGARLINFVLALVLLGWYAVTAELFGRTCYLTMADYFSSPPPQWFFTIACSALVIATTVFGFRAIDRLSLLVAPLLVLLTGCVAYRALEHVPWSALMAMPGTGGDLSTGISAVIGGMIVNVVLMPDITRYSRSTFDCALISIAGNGVGAGAALILAMLPALAFHEEDPMRYMAALGLVTIAFATLVLSTWTINAINLYSTGLVTSTAFRNTAYGRIVIACGTVGTIVAVIGIADRLIGFLVLLGLIVPPIAGVYLTDFFVLGRRDYAADQHVRQSEVTNLNGILACVAGGAIGILTYYLHASITGVPTIESFVSAGLLYAIAEKLRGMAARDRRGPLPTRLARGTLDEGNHAGEVRGQRGGQPVARDDVLGSVVGNPGLPLRVLPDQSLERQVQTRGRHGLHQRRPRFRVPENQHTFRSHGEAHARRIGREIEPGKYGDAVLLEPAFEALDRVGDRVTRRNLHDAAILIVAVIRHGSLRVIPWERAQGPGRGRTPLKGRTPPERAERPRKGRMPGIMAHRAAARPLFCPRSGQCASLGLQLARDLSCPPTADSALLPPDTARSTSTRRPPFRAATRRRVAASARRAHRQCRPRTAGRGARPH